MTVRAKPFPWVVTSLVAVSVVLWILSRVEVSGVEWRGGQTQPTGAGAVVLSELGEAPSEEGLRGELILKDPTPLFLPTAWNSGQVDAQMDGEMAVGTSFGAIDAKLAFTDTANDLDVPDGVTVPDTAQAAMDRVSKPVGHGELTRRDAVAEPLPTRRGYLEILAADTGKLIYTNSLGELEVGQRLTAPVELVLAVSGAGLWVRPTVMEAPDGAAVDFDQINSALKAKQLDAILSPGIYRILLGP